MVEDPIKQQLLFTVLLVYRIHECQCTPIDSLLILTCTFLDVFDSEYNYSSYANGLWRDISSWKNYQFWEFEKIYIQNVKFSLQIKEI